MYEERLVAKSAHNEALQTLYKLTMNGFYGKLGQKINPSNKYGTQQELTEFVIECEKLKKPVKVVNVNQIYTCE